MDPPEDSSLVSRVKAGDQGAFDQLYRRHASWASRMAHMLVFNHHVAEEVVQEAFFQAWRRIPSLRRTDSFGPLLRTILVRGARRALRVERHTPSITGVKAISSGQPWTHEVEQRVALRDALRSLSPVHRAVIALRYLQGYEATEIARMMGCPAGTVRSRLFFARRHMGQYLDVTTERPGCGGYSGPRKLDTENGWP